jgi:hypothetical protein
MESSWQHAKIYEEHETDGRPNAKWYEWAIAGYANKRANRYPAGKGRKPLYSWWNGEKLDYVSARKKIYIPIYTEAVSKGDAYWHLLAMHHSGIDLALLDFDVYRNDLVGMSFADVINSEDMKMGHGFVLAMMLTGYIPGYDKFKDIE